MSRLLDIVISHYDEPFSMVRPCLDMLRNQKSVDYNQFRVTLIHDGTDLFKELEGEEFPFEFNERALKEHRGVSAVRNLGIDTAEAKWITFFDCDDCLSSIYSIRMILQGLNDDRFDFMWHSFYANQTILPGSPLITMNFFNLRWMCAKYFRVDFLKEHHIRFNEDLEYSEDGAFDYAVYLDCKEGRIGEIKTPFPLYAWIRRPGSATTDIDKFIRNSVHAFRSNVYVSNLFRSKNRAATRLKMARTVTDAYICLTQKRMNELPAAKDILHEVEAFISENYDLLAQVTEKEWDYVLNASTDEAKSEMILNPERPPFKKWYEGVLENV